MIGLLQQRRFVMRRQRRLLNIKHQLHRGRSFVDMLPAGTTGADGLPVDFSFINGDSGSDLDHKLPVFGQIGASVTGVTPLHCRQPTLKITTMRRRLAVD